MEFGKYSKYLRTWSMLGPHCSVINTKMSSCQQTPGKCKTYSLRPLWSSCVLLALWQECVSRHAVLVCLCFHSPSPKHPSKIGQFQCPDYVDWRPWVCLFGCGVFWLLAVTDLHVLSYLKMAVFMYHGTCSMKNYVWSHLKHLQPWIF